MKSFQREVIMRANAQHGNRGSCVETPGWLISMRRVEDKAKPDQK